MCSNETIPGMSMSVIYNDGTKYVTSFCSTDNCNTGIAKDNATLWCYYGTKNEIMGKQSCTSSCVVIWMLNKRKINLNSSSIWILNLK